MDIKAAFDAMRPVEVHHVLLQAGAPEQLATAWLRENVGMSAALDIAGVPSDGRVAVSRGCRQGGARTPNAWNRCMERLLLRARADTR